MSTFCEFGQSYKAGQENGILGKYDLPADVNRSFYSDLQVNTRI